MATDSSEPPMQLITAVAVGTIALLVLLRLFLISYFDQMLDDEAFRKVDGRPPTQLIEQRAHEHQLLERGAVPVSTAMQIIAGGSRPPLIAPQPSTDHQALEGWSLLRSARQPPVSAPPTASSSP
jgi:hypothetical protein